MNMSIKRALDYTIIAMYFFAGKMHLMRRKSVQRCKCRAPFYNLIIIFLKKFNDVAGQERAH